MKIVNRKTFLNLPPGTVFQKYQPLLFEAIQIKESTTSNNNNIIVGLTKIDSDYIFQDLTEIAADSSEEMLDIIENAVKTGESFQLDFEATTRDGMFDKDQLFAVW